MLLLLQRALQPGRLAERRKSKASLDELSEQIFLSPTSGKQRERARERQSERGTGVYAIWPVKYL